MAASQFVFGAMSPYSWFAAERIDALIDGVVWRPVFAGGLFRDAGRGSWGLSERRAAGIADCEARAARHGLGPMRWPDGWPAEAEAEARGRPSSAAWSTTPSSPRARLKPTAKS
jgi:2-hydroxychromene-2-carboxylate isomerase